MKVVISQSMYFPWVGMLEQIRLADIFIHYDDVQFSKGSFTNRVQVKHPGGGRSWMTVPLRGLKLGQRIDEVAIAPPGEWVPRHLAMLEASFAPSSWGGEALALAKTVLDGPHETIAGLARSSMLALAGYFGLAASTRFADSRELGIGGSSSRRVLDLVKAVGGSTYITGHGARAYLDHALFEAEGIEVRYMDYRLTPYPQPHGAFTPYVTGLDLIAACGRQGKDLITSTARNWREDLDGTRG